MSIDAFNKANRQEELKNAREKEAKAKAALNSSEPLQEWALKQRDEDVKKAEEGVKQEEDREERAKEFFVENVVLPAAGTTTEFRATTPFQVNIMQEMAPTTFTPNNYLIRSSATSEGGVAFTIERVGGSGTRYPLGAGEVRGLLGVHNGNILPNGVSSLLSRVANQGSGPIQFTITTASEVPFTVTNRPGMAGIYLRPGHTYTLTNLGNRICGLQVDGSTTISHIPAAELQGITTASVNILPNVSVPAGTPIAGLAAGNNVAGAPGSLLRRIPTNTGGSTQVTFNRLTVLTRTDGVQATLFTGNTYTCTNLGNGTFRIQRPGGGVHIFSAAQLEGVPSDTVLVSSPSAPVAPLAGPQIGPPNAPPANAPRMSFTARNLRLSESVHFPGEQTFDLYCVAENSFPGGSSAGRPRQITYVLRAQGTTDTFHVITEAQAEAIFQGPLRNTRPLPGFIAPRNIVLQRILNQDAALRLQQAQEVLTGPGRPTFQLQLQAMNRGAGMTTQQFQAAIDAVHVMEHQQLLKHYAELDIALRNNSPGLVRAARGELIAILNRKIANLVILGVPEEAARLLVRHGVCGLGNVTQVAAGEASPLLLVGTGGLAEEALQQITKTAPGAPNSGRPPWFMELSAELRAAINELGPDASGVLLNLEHAQGLKAHLTQLARQNPALLAETLQMLKSNSQFTLALRSLSQAEASNVLFAAGKVIPAHRAQFLAAAALQSPEVLRTFPSPGRWNTSLKMLKMGGRAAVPALVAVGLAFEAYTFYESDQEVKRLAHLRKQLEEEINTVFSVANGFDPVDGNQAERKSGGGERVFVQRETGLRFDVTHVVNISDEVLSAATWQMGMAAGGTVISVLALVGGFATGTGLLAATGLVVLPLAAAVAAPILIIVNGQINEGSAYALRRFITSLDPRLLNFFRITSTTGADGREIPGVSGRSTADLIRFIIENRGSTPEQMRNSRPEDMVRAMNRIAGAAVFARLRETTRVNLGLLNSRTLDGRIIEPASYVVNSVTARSIGIAGNNGRDFNMDSVNNWSVNIPEDLDQRIDKLAAQKLQELTQMAVDSRLDRMARHERATAHFAQQPPPAIAPGTFNAPRQEDIITDQDALSTLRQEITLLLLHRYPPPLSGQSMLTEAQIQESGQRSDALRAWMFGNTPYAPVVYRYGNVPENPEQGSPLQIALDRILAQFRTSGVVISGFQQQVRYSPSGEPIPPPPDPTIGNLPRVVQVRQMTQTINGMQYEGILVTVIRSSERAASANDQQQFFAWRRAGPALRGVAPGQYTIEPMTHGPVTGIPGAVKENVAQVQIGTKLHEDYAGQVREEGVKKQLAGPETDSPAVRANSLAAGRMINAVMGPPNQWTVLRSTPPPQEVPIEFVMHRTVPPPQLGTQPPNPEQAQPMGVATHVTFQNGQFIVRTFPLGTSGPLAGNELTEEMLRAMTTPEGGTAGELGQKYRKQADAMYAGVQALPPEMNADVLGNINSPIAAIQLTQSLADAFPGVQGPEGQAAMRTMLLEVYGGGPQTIGRQQMFAALVQSIGSEPRGEMPLLPALITDMESASRVRHRILDAQSGAPAPIPGIPGLPPNAGQSGLQ